MNLIFYSIVKQQIMLKSYYLIKKYIGLYFVFKKVILKYLIILILNF